MYQRGGNRGWHHGHYQSDMHAPRDHHSGPYRGGYHDHRGHGNYGPYHDRNYNDNDYVEYPETFYREFQDEDRNYKEYRGHRDPGYHRGGRHNSGNNKFSGYRGGYQRGRGQSSHYQNKTSEPHYKKYDSKPAKTYKKENEDRVTTPTAKALQTVNHNSGPTLLTLTDGTSENETESKSPAQDKTKAAQVCDKPSQESTKAGQVCEKPSQESTKAGQVYITSSKDSANTSQVHEKPSQESVNAAQVYKKPSQENVKATEVCKRTSQESTKAAQVCEKSSQESTKTSKVGEKPSQKSAKPTEVYMKSSKESTNKSHICEKPSEEKVNAAHVYKKPSQESAKVVQVCENSSQKYANKNNVKKEYMDQVLHRQKEKAEKTPPPCDTKTAIKIKEDIDAAEERPQEKPMYMRVRTGKRTHSEERDVILNENQKDTETCIGKRICRSQDHCINESYMEKTVQIPLLGDYLDMSPETLVTAGTSKQENSVPGVRCGLSDSEQELRTAFILAKKEEIELAFAQDCKTFACVASTLLKKDPSIEAAVTNALRSSLQEMAGRCVQEMTSFIDHYDKVLVDTSNRLQN